MSDDGADMGVKVDRALESVLGGKDQPSEDERRTPEQMYVFLKAKDDDVGGYDSHAEVIAKYLLELYEEYPELTGYPTENVYRKDQTGTLAFENGNLTLLVEGIDSVAKKLYPEGHAFCEAVSAATGFTWGWAVNAARYALGLPSVPNPAIVTIG